MIKIYTDGSAINNPGLGGWAVVTVSDKGTEKLSGSVPRATNNQMELMAVTKALESLSDDSAFTIYSDSQYVINGINIWSKTWRKNNLRTSNGKPIANAHEWNHLFKLVDSHPNGLYEWVKGHSVNYYNNITDELARNAALNQ